MLYKSTRFSKILWFTISQSKKCPYCRRLIEIWVVVK